MLATLYPAMGYRRGLLLIYLPRFPTTYNSKISLRRHAFFLPIIYHIGAVWF